MDTIISHNEAETIQFGESQAKLARPGRVIGLSGELGTGKTQFMKGFSRGLGFEGRISSPTFGLIHHYESPRGMIFHVDLYRLESQKEIIAAGLEEILISPDGVSVVEWVERYYPDPMAEIEANIIDFSYYRFRQISENEREISHAHSRP
jgi:tRNA threonylcarbamoyladenosine biosynthesis protein TsaE